MVDLIGSDETWGAVRGKLNLSSAKGGLTAVALGDSKTQSMGYTNDPRRQCDTNYLVWLNAMLGGRIEILNNAGIGGEVSTAIRSRLVTDALSYSPNLVFMWAGNNDLNQAGGYDHGLTTGNILAMVETCYFYGARPFVLTCSPTMDTNINWTSTRAANCHKLNAWIRQLPQMLPRTGVIVIDAFKAQINPLSATSQPKANYLQSDDGIHENPLGAYAVALEAFSVLDPLLPKVSILPLSAADRYAYPSSGASGELIDQPLFTDSGGSNLTDGTIVGTGAATWNLSKGGTWGASNGTIELSSRSDGFGNNIVVGVTNSPNENNSITLRSSELLARTAPGTATLQMVASVRVESPVNFRGVAAYLEVISPSLGTLRGSILERAPASVDAGLDGAAGYPQVEWDYPLKAGRIPIPADATSIRAVFSMRFGASGSAVIRVGRVGVRAVA